MKKFRIYFIIITGLFLYTLFITGLTHYEVKNRGIIVSKLGKIGDLLYNFSEILVLSKQFILQKDNYRILDYNTPNGVTYYNKEHVYNDYYLLNSYKSNKDYIIDLVSLENGKTLKEWKPNLDEINNLTLRGQNRLKFETYNRINYLLHPILFSDSSLIFGTQNSLVKIDSNAEIIWLNSEIEAHHSLEIDHEMNLWISGRRISTKLDMVKDKNDIGFYDDLILKIDPRNGEVLFEKSVIQILIDNNLENKIFENGNFESDPIHLNDVQPAISDSNYWKKGDLLISSRHLSSIFLYRPTTNKVLWYKQGPWLNQHDPNFLRDNKISVFGNQVIRGQMKNKIKNPSEYNSVFIYDFRNDSVTEPYKNFFKSEKIQTFSEGRSKILDNGDLFVEESNKAKIYIGDYEKKILTFSRRLNKKEISYLHWSRLIKN